MKKGKLSWVLLKIEQKTESDQQGMAFFNAELCARRLPGVVVTVAFWGSQHGLPGGRYSQADAFIRAVISQPVSIEEISLVCAKTSEEHAAEGLSIIR